MQQSYIDVNGVTTKVMTWGRGLQEVPEKDAKEDLIIMIPGNPGVTRFYTTFLQTVYEQTGCPIWIVGHAGHELPLSKLCHIPPLEGNETLYGLKGQIDHKVRQFVIFYT